jgi:hypothetical protein
MTLAGMNESGIVEFRPLNDIGVCQSWFGCGEHHLVQAFVEACDRYNDADKKCQAEQYRPRLPAVFIARIVHFIELRFMGSRPAIT